MSQTASDYRYINSLTQYGAETKQEHNSSNLNQVYQKTDQTTQYTDLYGPNTLNTAALNINYLPAQLERLKSLLTVLRQKENQSLSLLEPYFARCFSGKPSCIDRSDGVASITPKKVAPSMTRSKLSYRERIVETKKRKLKLYKVLLPWSTTVQNGLSELTRQYEFSKLFDHGAKQEKEKKKIFFPGKKAKVVKNAKKRIESPAKQKPLEQIKINSHNIDLKNKSHPILPLSFYRNQQSINIALNTVAPLFAPPAVLRWTPLSQSSSLYYYQQNEDYRLDWLNTNSNSNSIKHF